MNSLPSWSFFTYSCMVPVAVSWYTRNSPSFRLLLFTLSVMPGGVGFFRAVSMPGTPGIPAVGGALGAGVGVFAAFLDEAQLLRRVAPLMAAMIRDLYIILLVCLPKITGRNCPEVLIRINAKIFVNSG